MPNMASNTVSSSKSCSLRNRWQITWTLFAFSKDSFHTCIGFAKCLCSVGLWINSLFHPVLYNRLLDCVPGHKAQLTGARWTIRTIWFHFPTGWHSPPHSRHNVRVPRVESNDATRSNALARYLPWPQRDRKSLGDSEATDPLWRNSGVRQSL